MIKCSICGVAIKNDYGQGRGHNPEPVSDGRCCDQCNLTVVIPYRIMLTNKEDK
jgi:hypothetical protein